MNGATKAPTTAPAKTILRIEVRPSAVKDFYQERMGFSLLGFLKSPMILMALVSVVMIVGMPYLMDNSESLIACEGDAGEGKMDVGGLTRGQWIRRPRRSLRRCKGRVLLVVVMGRRVKVSAC